MTDLMHWHGRPSELRQPPECCAAAAKKARDEAVHAERRRVVLSALKAIDAYWSAASSVLDMDSPGPKLATAVVDQCRRAIQAAGCICPMVDVTQLNDPYPRQVPGGDVNCGLHGAKR